MTTNKYLLIFEQKEKLVGTYEKISKKLLIFLLVVVTSATTFIYIKF